jgi:hypothetical protein
MVYACIKRGFHALPDQGARGEVLVEPAYFDAAAPGPLDRLMRRNLRL